MPQTLSAAMFAMQVVVHAPAPAIPRSIDAMPASDRETTATARSAALRDKTTKAGSAKDAADARHRGKDTPRRATKVKGGWRLPGDPQIYPYDPLVPPDMVDPVPSRPRPKPGTSR